MLVLVYSYGRADQREAAPLILLEVFLRPWRWRVSCCGPRGQASPGQTDFQLLFCPQTI